MRFHVSIERPSGLEALPTDLADVRSLSGVDQNVSPQVFALHEALPAHLTQEAPLLVVEADVRVQSPFLGEVFAADATGESPLTGVDLQVRFEVANLVKGLRTVAAGEGLLSGVDPPVHQQRRPTREVFSAGFAGAADTAMGLQVSGEAVGGVVLLSANCAAAVWILGVSPPVINQQLLLLKDFPANSARVRPRAFRSGSVNPPMGRHVFLEALPFAELLAANAAGVDRRLGVLLRVALQRGRVAKGARTFFTSERLLRSVDVHVGREVALLAELFAAVVAAERLLAGVQPDVEVPRQDGGEGSPTEGAGFAALLVSLQVNHQAAGRV